jgi:cytidine deaminase
MVMKESKLLVQAAKEAQKNAYAPYSKFKVGAALLTTDNKITLGCNIENASYGLTVCAERVAIFKAVSEGYKKFKAIAVVTSDGSYPCGACLQVMAEFAPNLTVIISNGKGKTKTLKLKQLLTSPFKL